MIVVIDASGDPQLAKSCLARRGIEFTVVLERRDLKPGAVLGTLARLRKSPIDACYIFCRHLSVQYNRFGLKMVALLSGAKQVFFCDPDRVSAPLTPARILGRELPLFLCRCVYAFLVVILFSATYVILSLLVSLGIVRLRKENRLRGLVYLKTDFWPDLKAGGSLTHTKEFINAGVQLGYSMDVFSVDPLVHYGLKPQVHLIKPSSALFDFPIVISQMEYNLRFPLLVARALGERRPLGLYQRNSDNNFSGVFLSLMLRVPLILEFNSSSPWIAKNWHNARFSSVEQLCEKVNLKGAYRVAVVSDELGKKLDSIAPAREKVFVNPNGVDPNRFGTHIDASSIRSRFPLDKQLVGFIGVFAQWHGVLTLMACVKHVLRACRDAHFLIIGDGLLKRDMIEVLRRDGVEEHVTFAGLVAHDLAPAYLNACDVLVSPHEDMADGSTFFGSPTKIFEYMATGKAIVASNVGQLGRILNHEKDAILVRQKDETQLADAIVRLLRDSGLRERLGEAARSKVAGSYTWEENFRRVVNQLGN